MALSKERELLCEGQWIWISTSIQEATYVSVLENGVWGSQIVLFAPALSALSQALEESCISFEKVKGFVYDQGPGSTLGIRIATITIATLRQFSHLATTHLFAFQTLPLASLLVKGSAYSIISEATLGYWNLFSYPANTLTTLPDRCLGDCQRPVYHLQQRKHSHSPPIFAQALSFSFQFPLEKATDLLFTP